MSSEHLQFRAEEKHPRGSAIIERLLAHPVSSQCQRPRFAIPNSERKHAVQSSERVANAPVIDCGEQHLGIRAAAPLAAQSPVVQLAPNLAEIVYLAVEDDGVPATRRYHWLMARRGQIDN